jgi:hypothetical protein
VKQVAVMALLIALACRRDGPVRPGHALIERSEGRVVLGPKTTTIIGDPDSVRAWRIASPFDPNFAELQRTHSRIDEYPMLEEKRVTASAAAHIAAALLDRRVYGNPTACIFDPHHALLFRRGADSVIVVICLKCGDMNVHPSASVGERRTSEAINGPSGALYRALDEVFPERTSAAR